MEETKVSEALLALASAVSGKDLTSEGDGTKATALTVLSDALGDPETDADTALYDAAQFATRRSTDTEEAAKSVLALSSGGGSQSYPLTVSEASRITVTFLDYSTGDEITEAPAGTIVRIDCGSLEGNSGSLSCTDQSENYPVCEKSGYLAEYDIFTAVPIGGLIATVYVD